MIPTVSAHAFQRYCERILHARVSELPGDLIVALRAEIADQASLPPRLAGIRTWRKRTSVAVFVVFDGMVVTVAPPSWWNQHWAKAQHGRLLQSEGDAVVETPSQPVASTA